MVDCEDTKLHEAVRLGDAELVEEALEEGLDPDAIGLYQWCPLHEASSNGDLEILELLLQYKADPNKPDNLHASTPLHYAAKEGHGDCLKALVRAGGVFDVPNTEGETPLDLASGECGDILDRERTRHFIELSLNDARKAIHRSRSNESVGDVDFTNNFGRNSAGRTTPTAWAKIEVIERANTKSSETGTGLLQCSFEYNSKSRSLKIRVWQVEEVLMPPGEFSSISRIYVKSHLLPDKKGDSKRRTDEIKLDDASKMESSIITLRKKSALEGFKAIFLPSTFKFSKALVYKDIDKDVLPMKTVHLDVCVRLKYSTKSLPIASLQVPLKEAVRKLRKEKFRLLPCINYSASDNVHTADPSDFIVVMEGLYANRTLSNPTLRKKSAIAPNNEEKQERATSDINLKTVRYHSLESIPTVLSSEEDKGVEMMEVKVDSTNVTSQSGRVTRHSPTTVVEIHHEGAPLPGSTEDVSMAIKVEPPSRQRKHSTAVELGNSDSETVFRGDSGRVNKDVDKGVVVPKILVTTPEGVNDKGETVAIEMRQLIKLKMKESKQKTTEKRGRKSSNFSAKPGHVVDLRTTAVEKDKKEPQKWASSSTFVIGNKAYDENETIRDEVRRGKSIDERIKDTQGRHKVRKQRGQEGELQRPAPDVTYNFISEEVPREKRSPRSSPSRSLSSEASSSRNHSPTGSSSSREGPAPRRIKKDPSEAKLTGSNPERSHHLHGDPKMIYINESSETNRVASTPEKVEMKSRASRVNDVSVELKTMSLIDVVDETSPKEQHSPSRRSKFTPVRPLLSDLPPSPLVVKEVSEIDSSKSKSPGNGRLKKPSVRRVVDFGITPPLTKGIKTTDLITPSGLAIGRLKSEQVKINLSHLQNNEPEEGQ